MTKPKSSGQQQNQKQQDESSQIESNEGSGQDKAKHKEETKNTADPEEAVDQFFREVGVSLKDKFKAASLGESVTAGATIILAISGIFALWIYGCQLQQFKLANKITQESIHSNERAWVGVKEANPVSFEKGADADSNSRFQLTVTFKLRNYGHSAAQHVRIFPQLEVADSSNTTTGICNDSAAGKYVGDVLLPEQERDIFYGTGITVADMESALKRQNPRMERNVILSLRGCIEYIDDPTETSPHHTPVLLFRPEDRKRAVLYARFAERSGN